MEFVDCISVVSSFKNDCLLFPKKCRIRLLMDEDFAYCRLFVSFLKENIYFDEKYKPYTMNRLVSVS